MKATIHETVKNGRFKCSVKFVLKEASHSSRRLQTDTRQDQQSSLVAALFSVGFFQRRFGNYYSTTTWWSASRAHSSVKNSFSWPPTTLVRRGSRRHTGMTGHVAHRVPHTPIGLSNCSALLPLSLQLCISLSAPLCPFTTSQERKCGKREKKKQDTVTRLLRISLPSLSRSGSSLSSTLPCSTLLLPVSGMSWPCLRGVSVPPVSSQLNLLILLPHAALLQTEDHVCTCITYAHKGVLIFEQKLQLYKIIREKCWQKSFFLHFFCSIELFFQACVFASAIALHDHIHVSIIVTLPVGFWYSKHTLSLSLAFACMPVNHKISNCTTNISIFPHAFVCPTVCSCGSMQGDSQGMFVSWNLLYRMSQPWLW